MKTSSLIAFAALILLGWTTLAGGVIAVFAGDPTASQRSHSHVEEVAPTPHDDAPCVADKAADASVPCPV